jgi:hypothetical protein
MVNRKGKRREEQRSDSDKDKQLTTKLSESEKQVLLHYIDKLYSDVRDYIASSKRISFAVLTLSLLLLALSSGAASTRQELTFSGIGFKLPFAVFLTATAALLTFLVPIKQVLDQRAVYLESHIEKLYELVGLPKGTWQETQGEMVLETGRRNYVELLIDVIAVTFTRPIAGARVEPSEGVIFGAWYVVYLLGPTAGQAAAGFKVSELLQKQGLGWAWIPFVCLVLITFLMFWWAAMAGRRANQDPSEPRLRILTRTPDITERALFLFVALLLTGISVGFGYFVARTLGSL